MQKTSQQNKKLSIVKLVIQSLKFEYLLRISQLIHPELFFFLNVLESGDGYLDPIRPQCASPRLGSLLLI